ncbi:regulatory protein GemA [Methylobacterium sp. J-088]|uniref:regulatory protein GemA n=1 Tax=Methylobacterium sp. J-088 TaxID=2836664 RepID=UPI001FBB9C1E|nr:regulatory protein GemA [Methylobacterium sp. J-088]MCJ2065973.1 regulatory protein GemA [Methylobacterium sp. J-088]
MIRPAQLKLLDRARAAALPEAADFTEVLRHYGGADRIEDLTAAGLDRLLDHLTVTGFRSRQRPIISARARKLIEEAARQLGLTPHVHAADLRGHGGVADLRDLVGRGLLDLLARWERRGLDVVAFNAARREISPAQLRLLQVARKRVEMVERRWHAILQDFGGVVSAADLDRRGVDLIMAFLEAEGFDRAQVVPAAPVFGRRAGFASPEQVDLIRTLWREWTSPTAESEAGVEAGLNTWLDRYHGASSLRFLTSAGAGKVITALKTMKARKGKREASHA